MFPRILLASMLGRARRGGCAGRIPRRVLVLSWYKLEERRGEQIINMHELSLGRVFMSWPRDMLMLAVEWIRRY
jgi:hypothetical protein